MSLTGTCISARSRRSLSISNNVRPAVVTSQLKKYGWSTPPLRSP